MDPTAIQSGTAPPKATETAIQPGLPTTEANGQATAPAEAPRKQPKQPKHPAVRILETLASLRITVVLFALSMVLVFYGTLAQVDNGVWTIVAKYFRSAVVLIPLKVLLFNTVEDTKTVFPFPGGWLLGGAMLVNLLAAHAIRFKLAWNRAGILLIHAGLIIIMIGEVVTGVFAVEGQMIIHVGQTVNFVTLPGNCELAIVRTVSPSEDEVISVPSSNLKNGAVITNDNLPFKIEVVQYMVNSELLDYKEGMANPATKGFGRQSHVARELPEIAGVANDQRFDAPSAYLKLTGPKDENLGVWLYSLHFDPQPQWIEVGDKKYQVSLRFRQKELPAFSFHLTKFEHKVFAGAPDKPKDFRSHVTIVDKNVAEDRKVEIYMNAPLRYQGMTFYQSSWTTDQRGQANGTILQVVTNPGWLMPYISCAVVTLGMLIHFGVNLFQFVERRRSLR